MDEETPFPRWSGGLVVRIGGTGPLRPREGECCICGTETYSSFPLREGARRGGGDASYDIVG